MVLCYVCAFTLGYIIGIFLFAGWILIDRSGKHFGTILNFLRDGKAILPHSRQDLEELHAEAKYYLVSELVDKCQKALKLKKDEQFPVCRIPVITSPREAKLLVSRTRKVEPMKLIFIILSLAILVQHSRVPKECIKHACLTITIVSNAFHHVGHLFSIDPLH